MGIKSKTNNKVTKSDNVRSTTHSIYLTVKRIDEELSRLYSLKLTSGFSLFRSTINYSTERDDEVGFNQILDKTEEYLNTIDEVRPRQFTHCPFRQEFPGLLNFLYEARDYKNNRGLDEHTRNTPSEIKNRFIKILDRFRKMGINPSDI